MTNRGHNLRTLLKGKSYRQIARETGLTVSGVGRIFNRHRTPKFSTATRIAKSLGIGVEELFKGLREVDEELEAL
jgi:transcriptional regulator with XRE-family HTH domain